MKEEHGFGTKVIFVAFLLIILSMSTFWPAIVCSQTYQMRQDAYDGGGTIWGFALIFFALYLIGVVCLFFGYVFKLDNHSSTPKFYSTCFQIAKDQAGAFAGAVFMMHIFFSLILLIAYFIVLAIISKEMTTEGFIAAVAGGFFCSIIVALRMFLGKIEADKYFQNTSSTKSYNMKDYTCPILNAKFILIPAGTFMMGSPENEINRRDNERLHQVTISKPYYLQTTPVTQRQWELVMGSNPSYFKNCDDNCPVEQVSWNDIQEFIRELNFQCDKNYRLPTEAEWEYACRAGNNGGYCFGNNESMLGEYAWYETNSNGETHPVGLKRPNVWGLYDMHGNIWEWVQDWYDDYRSSSITDVGGPSSGASCILRGGSWKSDAPCVRTAYRFGYFRDVRFSDNGFRLAVSESAAKRAN